MKMTFSLPSNFIAYSHSLHCFTCTILDFLPSSMLWNKVLFALAWPKSLTREVEVWMRVNQQCCTSESGHPVKMTFFCLSNFIADSFSLCCFVCTRHIFHPHPSRKTEYYLLFPGNWPKLLSRKVQVWLGNEAVKQSLRGEILLLYLQ